MLLKCTLHMVPQGQEYPATWHSYWKKQVKMRVLTLPCTAPNQMIQGSTGRSPSDLLIQWKPHLEEGRAVERREGRAREACCGKWKRSPNDFWKQRQFYSLPHANHFFKIFGFLSLGVLWSQKPAQSMQSLPLLHRKEWPLLPTATRLPRVAPPSSGTVF